MMKRSEQASSPLGVGVITVITVLLALTLSIFVALTLSSARADLALSRINAETVKAYYAADAAAARRYAAFAAGDQAELEEYFPVGDRQKLHFRLTRNSGGEPEIRAWETVSRAEESEPAQGPELWDGERPG